MYVKRTFIDFSDEDGDEDGVMLCSFLHESIPPEGPSFFLADTRIGFCSKRRARLKNGMVV